MQNTPPLVSILDRAMHSESKRDSKVDSATALETTKGTTWTQQRLRSSVWKVTCETMVPFWDSSSRPSVDSVKRVAAKGWFDHPPASTLNHERVSIIAAGTRTYAPYPERQRMGTASHIGERGGPQRHTTHPHIRPHQRCPDISAC